MKQRSQTKQERAIMVGTTTTTRRRAATVVRFVFAVATVLGGGGLLAAKGSSTHISTHTGLVAGGASSYYSAAAAAASASAAHLLDRFGGATQRPKDCFSPDGPFMTTTTTTIADSSYRVLRRPKTDDDHDGSGSPPFLPWRRRRPDGRYRDKFTLRVALEMPTVHAAQDDDAAAFHEDEGSETGSRTVESELVVVTESTVASRDGGPFHRRHEVDVTYQEVSSRSTSVSSSSSSDHDKAPAWVEICHAKTTTVRSVSSGIRSVGRLRRRLSSSSSSSTSQEDAVAANRCAPWLLATTTTTAADSSGASGDTFSSTVGDTAPDFPTIPSRTAGIAAASATTTSRYLGVVPDFPVRIGDTWHVLLPWQGHDGDPYPPPPSGGGPSLTGVATLLGYRSSSCAKQDNSDAEPPNVAVIQVRGTEAALDWSQQLWGNVVGRDSGEAPSIAAPIASKTTNKASVVVGDVDVLAIVHFDVATQLVRRVEADQAFVLHVSGSDVGVDPSPFQVNSVAIPVRGRAVLETTQL
jgi:hypothetical protein